MVQPVGADDAAGGQGQGFQQGAFLDPAQHHRLGVLGQQQRAEHRDVHRRRSVGAGPARAAGAQPARNRSGP
jgi:hypothetical protein